MNWTNTISVLVVLSFKGTDTYSWFVNEVKWFHFFSSLPYWRRDFCKLPLNIPNLKGLVVWGFLFGLGFFNFTNISIYLSDGSLPARESCWQVACPAKDTWYVCRTWCSQKSIQKAKRWKAYLWLSHGNRTLSGFSFWLCYSPQW